jgi:hypothetical protein
MMKKPTGCVIYRGPSLLDGKPIVVVAITKSKNTKTANMVQTYILRADIDPRDANRTGQDASICGACPHRGAPTNATSGLAAGRTCYVRIDQGPLIVYKSMLRGIYPRANGHKAITAIGAGRMVRIGTYGDGAAVPSYIWDSLLTQAAGHTAYSHQSGVNGAAFDPARYMVSADSESAAWDAWKTGARTFRVIWDKSDVVRHKEVLCPASAEMGRRTTCDRCGLCGGASVSAKSIAIVAHGSGASAIQAGR